MTRGGWREHTDGNRISTTRGDVVEVIGGNYKLAVLGRVSGPHVTEGEWESSGGHNDEVSSRPGVTASISWAKDDEIVDRHSASAAELFAGCLQATGRATLLGENTQGKATAQRVVRAPEHPVSYATVASFLLPNRYDIHGCGLRPDLCLPAHSDEIFERALRLLRGAA